jgi:hypothetical protein
MKLALSIFLCFLAVSSCLAQSIFERIPIPAGQSIHLFGFDPSIGRLLSSGTGALYMVPHSPTNEKYGTPVIVTAKHNLFYPDSTNPLPALLVKLNVPLAERRAKYLEIPLKHDSPRNYWLSPKGLDLALVPYPIGLIDINHYPMFLESNVLSPERARTNGVAPGLIVFTLCHQPEYFSEIDFFLPTSDPIVRFGHLARLGWDWISETNWITRSHVIDMHASPGNSGATVCLNVVLDNQKVCRPFFLGIVQGYQEEASSYKPFEAPIKPLNTSAIVLTADDGTSTNQVALTIKTPANPDLTSVTPVDELIGLWDSLDFKTSIAVMMLKSSEYKISSGPEIN